VELSFIYPLLSSPALLLQQHIAVQDASLPLLQQWAIFIREATLSILGKQLAMQCAFPSLASVTPQSSRQDNHVLCCILQGKYGRNAPAVLIHHFAPDTERNLILNLMKKHREKNRKRGIDSA